MTIERTESVTYGVEDLATCVAYFEDMGLEKLEQGAKGADFRTLENQFVRLRLADDTALPTAPESGSTMREAVWGVDTPKALDAIGAELSRDREVTTDADGVLHSRDERGFAIAFGLVDRQGATFHPAKLNINGAVERVNQRVVRVPPARAVRIGHVVYRIPREGRDEATAFYIDRLGFRASDRVDRLGNFLRCGGSWDHHSLFLMWVRGDETCFDHVAFEVPELDDVFVNGQYMMSRGWTPSGGPGRQGFGSHLDWHFECPAGGTAEFYTDMDRFDETWTAGSGSDDERSSIWRLDVAQTGA